MKLKRLAAIAAVAAISLSLAACGSGGKSEQGSVQEKKDTSVVNIGATSTMDTPNPLVMSATWVNLYGVGMEFLPLVSQNDNLQFENMLADSITTDDNLTYTVKLDPKAKWSDGKPVTASDLEFTIMRMASPKVMNSVVKVTDIMGTDDQTGWLKEGAKSMDGLKVVDDHTLKITFKHPVNKTSFMNGYAQYILTVPKHVLENVPEKDLASYDWFNHPTVVSGPYIMKKHDANHFASFEANKNYWKGAPKIQYCNIKRVDSSQLLSGMKSGEIDIIAPLLGAIPQSDYDSFKNLKGAKTNDGLAITTETLFINGQNIPDAKVRQALLYALDRKTIAAGLSGEKAKLMDGFLVPDGPYYDGKKPVEYNPEKAKELLKEAGWKGDKQLSLYVDSGNGALVNAATLAQNYWKAVGINVSVVKENLDTLISKGGSKDVDMLGVQYTYPAVDSSWDIDWTLDKWCHLYPDNVKKHLDTIWNSNDEKVLKQNYNDIDAWVQKDVPVIALYAHGPLGVIRDSMENAKASTYGFTNNIQEWSFK